MKTNIKRLLTAVREKQSFRGSASAYEAAMAAGWLLWEDTYKRNARGEYGRGYVVTEAGLAELAKHEAQP